MFYIFMFYTLIRDKSPRQGLWSLMKGRWGELSLDFTITIHIRASCLMRLSSEPSPPAHSRPPSPIESYALHFVWIFLGSDPVFNPHYTSRSLSSCRSLASRQPVANMEGE
jgi:hypothetical protein